jgi:hypothetical protein
MSGARGEGAIIDRAARTIRLRHEPPGYVYRLTGDDGGDELEVVRVDQLTQREEPYGLLQRVRGRWRGAKGATPAKTDILALVARAWNQAPLLKG